MKKLCCIFNTPSLYREAIYTMIDESYDCDWYFEDTDNKLEVFDISKLRHVSVLHTEKVGSMYKVSGLSKLIREKEYSHYLMMGASRNLSTMALVLSRRIFHRNKRVYLWTHGMYGKENFFERFWKTILYKAADGIFIYGNYAKEILKKEGFDEKKLFVIHNSLDYDKQLYIRNTIQPSLLYKEHFGNENKNIVFIGRLTKVKRFDLLLDAIAELKSRGEFVNVTFIGDGVERENMEHRVKELGLDKQVWFYGACYDEQTNAEMIYNADLCVSPGNIGLTAMHVLMFGCPAITNDDFYSQMPEFEAIHDGVTGTFFKVGDSHSLAENISNWFLKHSSDREKVRNACYQEIDGSWNPLYQMNLIKNVIKQE